MEIVVNGMKQKLESETSLAKLLEYLGTPTSGVAVALNAQIVHTQDRMTIQVKEGDEIEIVTANPGG